MKSDFRQLDLFVKGFGTKDVVKVGVLSNKDPRKSGPAGNAELGAIHEFGSYSKHIPARSWLRMPIMQFADEIVAMASKSADYYLSKGDINGILRNLGIACEHVIQRAFATSGFGQWAPNAPSTIRKKGSSKPLIDTRQLARSVTSKVGKPE